MKRLIITHTNPLLDNYEELNVTRPESYAGFIYMWKCLPEDMFYIGSHKGICNDDYRGSGSRFKRVFEHYGITQFKRIILEFVEDAALIRKTEQKWLTKFNVVKSERFYNCKNTIKQ